MEFNWRHPKFIAVLSGVPTGLVVAIYIFITGDESLTIWFFGISLLIGLIIAIILIYHKSTKNKNG